MLELEHITYQPQTGRKKVLDDINIKINNNEIILISGESGSGKTTLLEIISGLTDPQRGRIIWKNQIMNSRRRRWLCGLVFQFPERFFLGATIGKELKFGYKSIKEIKIKKVLNKVGLSKINLTAPPEKLSGGQQRRLAVAVQLLREPNIILLDEPTAGLDWSMKNDVKDLILRLSSENSIIVVTHEPELFQELTSRKFLLTAGRLKTLGG
mgnify:FL=1|tara:strand:+ start:58 stop:690 length:633 start_codon:yes stop_codon:yes gene_type:complete